MSKKQTKTPTRKMRAATTGRLLDRLRVPHITVATKIPGREGGLAEDSVRYCDYLQRFTANDRTALLAHLDAIRAGILAEGMDQTVFAPGGTIMVLRLKAG